MRTTLRRRHGFPHKRRWSKTFVGGETLPVTFPSSPLSTRVYIALGADLTASWLTWNWLDITDRCRHDLGITLTVGRKDATGQVTPSRCQIKVDNNDGALCRRNPLGPYYGLLTLATPIWIQLDPGSGYVDRFHGFIHEWPTTWADESGTDAYATIQCSGVMLRLAQSKNLKSALYRTTSGVTDGDAVPLAYWSMEDGSNSTQAASGIPGGTPAVVTGSVTFAGDSGPAGSSSLLTIADGGSISGTLPGYTDTGQWFLQVALKIATAPTVDTDYVEIRTPGGDEAAWFLYIQAGSPDTVRFVGLNAAGVQTGTGASVLLDGSGDSSPSESDFYGHWWLFTLYAYYDTDLGAVLGGMLMTESDQWTIQSAGGVSSTVRAPATTWRIYGRGSGVSAGHVGFWADTAFTADTAVTNSQAFDGHAGELAHRRLARLCREERIPFTTDAVTSAAMGPQRPGNILALLRECEAADQGLLTERGYGLAYQSMSQRYNQPVVFDLDFSSGHIAGVPTPADDIQRLVNRFTASRSGGSSATAEREDGPLGTGTGGSGVFEGSASVNVEADTQLLSYAGMKVWLGTVDEDRWPELRFHLHGSPDLIPGWLSTPLGSRTNVANPPAPLPSQTINAVIEGYAERWDTVSWTAGIFTSPASPYDVGIAGDATTAGSWLQTGEDTALSAELASGATSATVAIDGRLFSTTASDLTYSPLSLIVGGEVMPVSAISGGSSPQTFTVTRTLAKTHPAGTPVQVYQPLIAAY